MARGKKTDAETIYKVMLSYITTRNFSETARNLDMAVTTVEKIVKDNRDKPEFVKLCIEKTDEFIEKADRIISKATTLLEKRLDTALESQAELDELIFEIWNADKDEIKEQQKKALVNKVSKLQLNSLSEITTAIGTLYDKRALTKGEATSRETLTLEVDYGED